MGVTWTVLGSWTFDPILGTGIVLAAGAYLYGVRIANRRTPSMPWPRRYTVSFLSAMAVSWVVLLGPPGAYDDEFFWAHMVQHLGLMMLVAPLILLGAPVLLILRASTPPVRRRWIVPALRSRVALALTNPVAGWLIFAGVLVATHFSGFFEYCLEHPLLPGNPGPRRVSYAIRTLSLFSMMFPETMTGFFIYATPYLMYPYYATSERPFGPSPVRDQQWGGAIMWSASMLIDAVWVTLAARDWLQNERRVAERIDMQTLRDMSLAATRARGDGE